MTINTRLLPVFAALAVYWLMIDNPTGTIITVLVWLAFGVKFGKR
jgi:hypothetical protein